MLAHKQPCKNLVNSKVGVTWVKEVRRGENRRGCTVILANGVKLCGSYFWVNRGELVIYSPYLNDIYRFHMTLS